MMTQMVIEPISPEPLPAMEINPILDHSHIEDVCVNASKVKNHTNNISWKFEIFLDFLRIPNTLSKLTNGVERCL